MRSRWTRLALVVVGTILLLGATPASDSARREKEGADRLKSDMAAARKTGRPQWLKDVPLELQVDANTKGADKAVNSRVRQGKMREALRIHYEVIDKAGGAMKDWGLRHIAETLTMAGEYAFAIIEYEKLPSNALTLRAVSRCYLGYDQYKKAAALANQSILAGRGSQFDAAKGFLLLAETYWMQGDVKRAQDCCRKAKSLWDAMAQSGKNAPVYGRCAIRAEEMATQVETVAELDMTNLKDGTYSGVGRGYEGDVGASVTVAGGKITRVVIGQQTESIPSNSLVEVPRRIVDRQTPFVDSVSQATISSHAVMSAAADALLKAK